MAGAASHSHSNQAVIARDCFDGVAFDLDGVITRTAAVHEAAWKRIFDDLLLRFAKRSRQSFMPFTANDYRKYVDGRPREDGIEAFLTSRNLAVPAGAPADGPDAETVHGLGRRKNDVFLELLGRLGVEVYPHAVELIQQLRDAGIKTAVVSASRNCAAVLRAAGIDDGFDAAVDGLVADALHLKGKPAPDTFLEAARRLNLTPARMAIVEDALAGVAAGRAGGFGLVIGVGGSLEADALKAHGADVVVPALSAIRIRRTPAGYEATHSAGADRAAARSKPGSESVDHWKDGKEWLLSYEGFDSAVEGRRETLLTLGNGYFATRGAGADAAADGVRYPGTYVAGGYNRLVSSIGERSIEHEDLVNVPNWLVLNVGAEREGSVSWFDAGKASELLLYRRTLDLRRGVLRCVARFRDAQGRITRLDERRFVHMRERHLAAQRVRVTPENWSGRLLIRYAIDGRVTNAGVARYQAFNARHLRTREATAGSETLLLETETTQSCLRIAQAVRVQLYRAQDDTLLAPARRTIAEARCIGHDTSIEASAGHPITIEKVMALYTSRDPAITDARTEALTAVSRAGRFADLVETHSLAWAQLWRHCDFSLDCVDSKPGLSTNGIVRLHMLHLLQTVSRHSSDTDAGVPARGWHGEAYRGHIFWDELFILPALSLRLPELARSLLLYRYRRLPEARWAARSAGYRGAMFPWQSGSNGREETDTVLFNPRSENFIRDHTRLQRHVNAAIAFNVWHYFTATGDADFLYDYGAELMLEIARFWVSIARWNPERGRFEIRGVMGPDEFHDAYPGADAPGIDNNAYTNVMAAWCIERALALFGILPAERCRELCEMLGMDCDDLHHWEDVSRKVFVPFHGDGIISQFEGYESLEEFDWKRYRRKYGNIRRLDLILEAEGDSPNGYKLSKQADVLTLFYLFSTEALAEIFARLGYRFEGAMIPRNIDYYLQRTSGGSTLSAIVHAWVLSRSCRSQSWSMFKEALGSDVHDVQGGTTSEGIHLGAMAGTLDLLQRCYTGLELRHGEICFNPALPHELARLSFRLRYCRHSLQVDIGAGTLSIVSDAAAPSPINVRVKTDLRSLRPGERVEFRL